MLCPFCDIKLHTYSGKQHETYYKRYKKCLKCAYSQSSVELSVVDYNDLIQLKKRVSKLDGFINTFRGSSYYKNIPETIPDEYMFKKALNYFNELSEEAIDRLKQVERLIVSKLKPRITSSYFRLKDVDIKLEEDCSEDMTESVKNMFWFNRKLSNMLHKLRKI